MLITRTCLLLTHCVLFVQIALSQLFLVPSVPSYYKERQNSDKNIRLKSVPRKFHIVIPTNNYVPVLPSAGILHKESSSNASAYDIFRVVGDVGRYKSWAGYGIQSIEVSDIEGNAATARYLAGAFGFTFVFSLNWEFYFAQEGKPYYAAFRLKDRTALVESISGQYSICENVQDNSTRVAFTIDTKLKRIIPGFIQTKIKELVVDVALYELIKYANSSSFSTSLLNLPVPRQLQLLEEEELMEEEYDENPLEKLRSIRMTVATQCRALTNSVRSFIRVEEGSLSYALLWYSFLLSQRIMMLLDCYKLGRLWNEPIFLIHKNDVIEKRLEHVKLTSVGSAQVLVKLLARVLTMTVTMRRMPFI